VDVGRVVVDELPECEGLRVKGFAYDDDPWIVGVAVSGEDEVHLRMLLEKAVAQCLRPRLVIHSVVNCVSCFVEQVNAELKHLHTLIPGLLKSQDVAAAVAAAAEPLLARHAQMKS